MKKDFSEIVFIIDKSGSMSGFEKDTIGGFNSMIAKQKNEQGEAVVTTVLFSNSNEIIHDRIPVDRIAQMTEKEYSVGGCTALIDAIGDTIVHIEKIHKYAREDDVPENTIFVITTDGMENASHKYSSDEVKKMIEKKKESGWEFLFLAANIDAVETAKQFGISEERAVDYCQDSAGTQLNYSVVGKTISRFRKNKSIGGASWKKEISDYKESRES